MPGSGKYIALLCAVTFVSGGCSDEKKVVEVGAAGATSREPLEVVAAFGPLAELAERVGGSGVNVTNLTKTGVEPHDLEMNTAQIDAIQDAALVVYLGESFQSAVEDAVKSRKGPSLELLSKVEPLEARQADDGEHDPHFWLDPIRMAAAAEAIGDALSSVDAAQAREYATNAANYGSEMKALDRELTTGLGGCKSRTFVTAHAAFGYLSTRYKLEQVPVAGISPEVEPDPARLADVADLVRTKGVTTIFTEELVSPKVAEALARETGATTAVLSPIEGFTDEDLKAGTTYATKMRENLAALQKALSC